MALNNISLRKLLKILFSDARMRRSEILSDIRDQENREAGVESGGGDFYAPFWADARDHVFGLSDLHNTVISRIDANDRRRNLYPLLRDGFLQWWNNRRRWTNEPFHPGPYLRAHFPFPGLDATVKVDSILSVRDGLGAEHAVYPYFSPEPILTEDAARLGLWLLARALPSVPPEQIRILDVIRGQTFSLDRHPLRGNEEDEFRHLYAELLNERANIESERR